MGFRLLLNGAKVVRGSKGKKKRENSFSKSVSPDRWGGGGKRFVPKKIEKKR